MGYIYDYVRGYLGERPSVGFVDNNGYVYNAVPGALTPNTAIGRVDEKGHVYRAVRGSFTPKVLVGMIDEKGYIYRAVPGLFTSQIPIGMVDKKGYVYDTVPGGLTPQVPIGEAEGPNFRAEGAALLLLLPDQKERESHKKEGTPEVSSRGDYDTGGGFAFAFFFKILVSAIVVLFVFGIIIEELIWQGALPYVIPAIVIGFIIEWLSRNYRKRSNVRILVYILISLGIMLLIIFVILAIKFFPEWSKEIVEGFQETFGT